MSKQEIKEQLKRTKSKEEYAKLLMDYFRLQEYYVKTVKVETNYGDLLKDFNGSII